MENAKVLLGDLVTAKQMEVDGKAADRIKLATGWEKGVDGKWFNEIGDATFTNAEAVAAAMLKGDLTSTLGNILQANETFKAYPQLKDYTFRIVNSPRDSAEGASSSGKNGGGVITINADKFIRAFRGDSPSGIVVRTNGLRGLRRVINHELAHTVQRIEGYAPGGNPDIFKRIPEDADDAQDLLNGLDHYLAQSSTERAAYRKDVVNGPIDLDVVKATAQHNLKRLLDAADNKDIAGPWGGPEAYLKKQRDLIHQLLSLPEWIADAHDRYEALAGEVQARAVMDRLDMSDEQRRAKLLSATADVVPEQQVILREAIGEQQSASAPPTGITHIDNVVRALKKEAPDLTVTVHKDEKSFAAAVKASGGANQLSAAFVDLENNEIHINLVRAKDNTLFHEAAHVVLEAAIANNPELVDGLYDQLADHPDFAKYKAFGELYKDKDQAQQRKEAIVEYMADITSGKARSSALPTSMYQKFKAWLKDMLNKLGFRKVTLDPSDVRKFAEGFGKAVVEGRVIRMNKEASKATKPSGPVDLLSLLNADGGYDVAKTDQLHELTKRIEDRKASIVRLDPGGEAGRIAGGRRNVEASILAAAVRRARGGDLLDGRHGSASDRDAGSEGSLRAQIRDAQERTLTQYAKAQGIWYDSKRIASETRRPLARGTEAEVFLGNDGSSVIKVMNPWRFSPDALRFIDDRITLHNSRFPDTAYELLGFGEHEGKFAFVLKQRYIDARRLQEEVLPLSQAIGPEEAFRELNERIFDALKKRGFDTNVGAVFSGPDLEIHDQGFKNVLADDDGRLYFIDTVLGLNPETAKGYAPFSVQAATQPSGPVDLLSLLNTDGSLNHGNLETLAGRVESGTATIARLDPSEEQGRIEGGRRNVEASLVLGAKGQAARGDERAVPQGRGGAQEEDAHERELARAIGAPRSVRPLHGRFNWYAVALATSSCSSSTSRLIAGFFAAMRSTATSARDRIMGGGGVSMVVVVMAGRGVE